MLGFRSGTRNGVEGGDLGSGPMDGNGSLFVRPLGAGACAKSLDLVEILGECGTRWGRGSAKRKLLGARQHERFDRPPLWQNRRGVHWRCCQVDPDARAELIDWRWGIGTVVLAHGQQPVSDFGPDAQTFAFAGTFRYHLNRIGERLIDNRCLWRI